MRLALILLVAVVGCAAPAPLVVAPAAEVTAPPALPPLETDTEVAVITYPVSVPGAAPEQVVRRRVYEEARVAEWTLDNGLTVVYAWDDGADGYTARLDAPGGTPALGRAAPDAAVWGPLTSRIGAGGRGATGRADRLDVLLAAVAGLFGQPPDSGDAALAALFDRPEAFTLVIHGSLGWDWVEGAVGRELSRVRGRRAALFVDPEAVEAPSSNAGLIASADDLATTRVLDALVRVRSGGDASVAIGPNGKIALIPEAASAVLAAPVQDAEVRRARTRAAADARGADGVVAALADLYTLPGRFRPARPPQVVRDLPDRIERTPPGRVRELLGRLRSASPTSPAADE